MSSKGDSVASPKRRRRGLAFASLWLGTTSIPAGILVSVLLFLASGGAEPAPASEPSGTIGRLVFVLGVVVGPVVGLVIGIVALARGSRRPQEYGGRGQAIAGVATSGLSSALVASIFFVSLYGRQKGLEAPALGDVRTVIAAEEFYHERCGFYSRLDCLSQPSDCIVGYTGPTFLDPATAALGPRNGYVRQFHPGPNAPPASMCRSGFVAFAYSAVPQTKSWFATNRGFCGDSRGVVTFTADGSDPAVREGQCAGQPVP